jgi:hypothetical protein
VPTPGAAEPGSHSLEEGLLGSKAGGQGRRGFHQTKAVVELVWGKYPPQTTQIVATAEAVEARNRNQIKTGTNDHPPNICSGVVSGLRLAIFSEEEMGMNRSIMEL